MSYPVPEKANILITGTPGTGKSVLCQNLSELTNMNCINIGELVATKELHCGRDENRDCWIIDDDKVCDELEDIMVKGNNIIDHHGCEFFPERWFHLIIVLRTKTEVLYERLEARNYHTEKIRENMQAEIMQVILENARESYDVNIIVELPSNTIEDMESNVQRIVQWLKLYNENNNITS